MTPIDNSGNYVDIREAIDENATALSTTARRGERSAGYGGVRCDAYGRAADGTYWPEYDGGLDEWRLA